MTDPCCPFCGRDPFHYVDIGVGYEAAAVVCCDLGDLYFRGMRPAPDEVTMSWDDFTKICERLARADAVEARLKEAVDLLDGLLGLEKGSGRRALDFVERNRTCVGGARDA